MSRSETLKKLWANPEVRKQRSEAVKRMWASPEFRSHRKKTTKANYRHLITEDELTHLYVREGLTMKQIAEKYGFHSEHPVCVRMKELGLVARHNPTPGRFIGSDGYVRLHMSNHPRANSQGWVLEHIVVWEKVHGTPVPENWIIHHLNGIKKDNRPENLVTLPNGEHIRNHFKLGAMLRNAYRRRIKNLEEFNLVLKKALKQRTSLKIKRP